MVLSLDDLPELAMIRVLKLIPLFDQLNARLVCKKWKVLIEKDILWRPGTELVLLLRVQERPLFWSRNHRPVDLNNSIAVNPAKISFPFASNPSKIQIQSSTCSKSFFNGVKRLFISTYDYRVIGVNELVLSFPNLEHLEVCNPAVSIVGDGTPISIDFSLPHLQTLHLDCIIAIIGLNCPALNALTVFGDFHLDERFRCIQSSLRFLKVRSFSHQPDWALPNLKMLCFSSDLEINITAFQKLKEVHYYYHRNVDEPMSKEFEIRVRETLASMFERNASLGRSIDVYYEGMKCRSSEEILSISNFFWFGSQFLRKEFDLLLKGSGELKLENVKKTFFVNDSLFDEFKDRLSDQSVEQLARSINDLVIASEACIPPQVIHKCSYKSIHLPFEAKMRTLLRYAQSAHLGLLPQSVLNELPDLMPNLLHIQSVNRSESKLLNFSFLSRFAGLKELHVGKEWLSIDLLTKIANNCRFLDKVSTLLESLDPPLRPPLHIERVAGARLKVLIRGPPIKVLTSTWTGVLDFIEENRVIKSHFFSDYFSKNYYLDNQDLNPIDYFEGQSH